MPVLFPFHFLTNEIAISLMSTAIYHFSIYFHMLTWCSNIWLSLSNGFIFYDTGPVKLDITIDIDF